MGTIIANRLVPDPSMTDAEYLHQRRVEAERAERSADRINLDVGKVWIQENIKSRIGALAFISPSPRGKRQPHHERAAEQFKNLYEARYGSGGGALDPSRVQVDTSPIAHDSGMAAKIDRTADIERVIRLLGEDASNRIIACVVLDIPCEEGAALLPSGFPNRRHVKREVDALLAALDSLAVLFGYRTRA